MQSGKDEVRAGERRGATDAEVRAHVRNKLKEALPAIRQAAGEKRGRA